MFAFTDEQSQLRDSVRRFLDQHASMQEVRTLLETGQAFNVNTYKAMLRDLGLGGIHVPEEYGGAGLSYVELCIVLEELGRALLPSPFFSSCVLATNALLLCGSRDQKQELLPKIISGELLATVALCDDERSSVPNKITASVQDGTFSGTKHFVIDGSKSDLIILVARDETSQIPSFWLVEKESDGITAKTSQSIDSTRQLVTLHFDDVPVKHMGETDQSSNEIGKFLDMTYVALANEMVGGAQALLDSSVEYAKTRVQFGRTIGSLQAIKHKCADLLLEIELAKSAAYVAANSLAEDIQEQSQHASIAKAAANDAYMRAAADTIQVHGGIGFTWDNDTHFWFKRAKSSEVLFGQSEFHRECLVEDLAKSQEVTV